MRRLRWSGVWCAAGVVVAALAAAGCGGGGGATAGGTGGAGAGAGAGAGGATTGTGGTQGASGGTGGTSELLAALVYDGAVDMRARGAISAPILPRAGAIYQPFPTTLAGEQAMAHDAALTFEWLLDACAPLYPAITLEPASGEPLTRAQLAINYEQVGRCSYEQFTAKPYWIPKLVDDVDICATELGAGWRLITEADLGALTVAQRQALRETLTPAVGTGDFFGAFYYGLAIWVRAADGTIAVGSLEPDAGPVVPLAFTNGFTATDHYEAGLGLRCIRAAAAP